MARRKPFTAQQISERKETFLRPALDGSARAAILKASEGHGLAREKGDALLGELEDLFHPEQMRRLADWEERPAAKAEAMQRIISAFEAFVSALHAAPVSIRAEVQKALGAFDVEHGVGRARELLARTEARIEGHNPKRDETPLVALARSTAGCGRRHLHNRKNSELAEWTYAVLSAADFIAKDEAAAQRDWEIIDKTLG